LPDVQIIFFDMGWEGSLSQLLTLVIANLPIDIVIILLYHHFNPDISYLQHNPRMLCWMFKYFIGNEDWLCSATHVQVLSQVVLSNSSVNSNSSPGWP